MISTTQTNKRWSRALTSSSLAVTVLLSSSLLLTSVVHAAPAPSPTYAFGFEGFPPASNGGSEVIATTTESAAYTAPTVPAFFKNFPWPISSHAPAPEPTTVIEAPAVPTVTTEAFLVLAPTPLMTDIPVATTTDIPVLAATTTIDPLLPSTDAIPSPSSFTEVVPTTTTSLPSPTFPPSLEDILPSPAPPPMETPGNPSEPFVSLPFEAPELHFDDEFDEQDLVGLSNIGADDDSNLDFVSFAAKPSATSSQKPYVNNWKCKPTPDKPAVVLVHATLLTANSWDFMAPKILKQGYCVFALTYGKIDRIPLVGAVDYLENSAAQVGNFVDQVLAATNTTQVNLVGHSQGGIVGRYWMKFLGGQGKVKRYVGISPIQQGTTLSGIVLFGKATGLFNPAKPAVDYFCPGCYQMVYDSDFMKKLNGGGDTIPGVIHSNLATWTDEIVTPWRNSYQYSGQVTNNVLQDYCLLALNEHLTIIVNPITVRWVLNQLDPSSAKGVNCLTFFS